MDRKYIAVYNCDNGYTCSCCGKWWDEVVEDIWDDARYTEEEIINHYKKKEYDGKELSNVYKVEKELIN